MASSPVNNLLKKCGAILDERQDVLELAIVTVLPTDVKNVEKLDFDENDVIEVFKKKNNKDHMCVGITSISRLAVIAFGYRCWTKSGLYICSSIQMMELHPLRTKHVKMSLKSPSDSPVHVVG